MKKIFRSISAVVLAVAVMLTAVVFDVPGKITAKAAGTHLHKACGRLTHNGCTHEDIEFEPFPDDTTEILRGKSYYLTKDIELSGDGRIFVEKGITNLCLNGHSIQKDGGQLIDINNIDGQTAELNICDCKGNGKIENTSDDSFYSCISVIDDCTLNLYGGTVDGGAEGCGIDVENNTTDRTKQGGTVNIYGGTVQTGENAAVWLPGNDTSLNVYGGEINSSAWNAIYVEGKGSTVSVCGGKIIGSATKKTALVANGKDVSVTIGGGEVIGENYAAVECSQGTVEINGGEVKSQSTSGSCVYNTDTLNVFGGTVSCNGYYGIYNYASGTATISSGTINSAGSAINNAARSSVTINGGNINSYDYAAIYNYGTLDISDGKINGEGTYGINNYENADLRISGGTVEAQTYALYNLTGGSADISGGKLKGVNKPCVWNDGTLDISGGEITSGDLNPVVNDGGTLSISGGSFGAIDSDTEAFIKNMGVFNLSGSPTFNNTSLWLASDNNIEITGELAYSEPCKVWINNSNLVPRIFTSGWSTYMGEKEPSDYFKSPYCVCTVAESDGEAVLRRFMITFNANGGSCETSDTSVNLAGRVLQLPNAEREGYSFDGWFTAADGGEKIAVSTVFTGDTELYAHWGAHIGNISKEVQSGENAPNAELTMSKEELINAVLTEEDKELINDGTDIKIILKIEDATNSITDIDKEAVQEKLGGLSNYKLGQYLDVSLLKKVGEQEETPITNTTSLIKVTFAIPSDFIGKAEYLVIRVHDGETTVLEDKDDNENTVTIQTDKFSTYALAYSENTNVTPPGGGSSGGNAPAPSVSKPTNSGDTSSESRGSSDNGTVTSSSGETSSTDENNFMPSESMPTESSGETSSTDENNFMPSESMPTDNNENPATGITMSLVPLAAAVIVLTVTIKRKRNK